MSCLSWLFKLFTVANLPYQRTFFSEAVENVEPAQPYFGDRVVTKRCPSSKLPDRASQRDELVIQKLNDCLEQLIPPDNSFAPIVIYFSVLSFLTNY